MPFDIQPIGATPEPTATPQQSDSVAWLDRQQTSLDAAWKQTGRYGTGEDMGAPSSSVSQIYADPKQYAIAAPAPPLVEPVAKAAKSFGKFGTVSINEIDPSATFASVLQGIGLDQTHVTQAQQGAQGFFDQRGIDAANAPSRLFDYATGWLGAVTDQATGKPVANVVPPAGSQLTYKFQSDPAYYALLRTPNLSDSQIHDIAAAISSRYAPGGDPFLTDQLSKQMVLDRQRALGLSSGDERTDYLAKMAFTESYINNAEGGKLTRVVRGTGRSSQTVQLDRPDAAVAGLAMWPAAIASALPIVGMGVAEAAYKHPQQIEDAWKNLTPQERMGFIQGVTAPSLVGQAVVFIPMFSGVGAIQAAAAVGQFGRVGIAAANVYSNALRVTNAVMAVGVSVMTANAIAEFASPAYAESLGKRIDNARPFSQSSMAGIINNLGYFASGTFGANLAARGALRVAGKVLDAAGVAPGVPELQFFKFGFGGSAVTRELATTGLDAGVLDLAPQATMASHLVGYREAQQRAGWDAVLRGEPTGIAEFDKAMAELSPEDRLTLANDALNRGVGQRTAVVEGDLQAMAHADSPRPLNDPQALDVWNTSNRIKRTIDDALAETYIGQYGHEWLARLAGSYTVKDMKAYAEAAVNRLGGDATKLGSHNEEGWAQVIRQLHAYEYTNKNAILHEASAGSAEADRLLMVQGDHLFANDAKTLAAALRDPATALDAVKKVIATREGGEWFAKEWKPEAGVARTAANVPPEQLARWVEESQPALLSRRPAVDPTNPTASMPLNSFHADLRKDGLWDLAYKPLDDQGNPISYIRRADGTAFRSPWIDYPLGSQATIEMGNRGYLLSKLDGAFRGFRAWRIAEYQKGSLFRNLAQFNVQPEQIDRFYGEVLNLAREKGIQPQTLGAVAEIRTLGAFMDWEKSINTIAKSVFGDAPLVNRAGVAVVPNWPQLLSRSFQQSARLNLTAGLTSYLKAHFGGGLLSLSSDIVYVAIRFNLSPLFKGGELVESAQLNFMRGVRGIDDNTLALYQNIGVGHDYSPLAVESDFDQSLRSMADPRATVPSTQSARNAQQMAFNARNLPEDFNLRAMKAQQQQAALRAMQPRPAPTEYGPNAELLPVSQLRQFIEMDRAVRPRFRGEDAGAKIDALAADIKTNGLKEPVIIEYDPATKTAMVSDGNHRIAAAEKAGLTDLPTRVVVLQHRTRAEFAGAAPPQPEFRSVPSRIEPDATGYIPADLKPSDIGLVGSVDPKTLPPLAADEQGLTEQLKAVLADQPKVGVLSELDRMVGGNGVAPGLEDRAAQIITKLEDIQNAKVDAGPTFKWDTISPEDQATFRAQLAADSWKPRLADLEQGDPGTVTRTRLDGTVETQPIADLYDVAQRKPGAATEMSKVAGTPEALFQNVLPRLAERLGSIGGPDASAWQRLARTFTFPTPWKSQQALRLEVKLMRDQFPSLLRLSGNDTMVGIYKSMGIPESGWLDHLITDRALAAKWYQSGSQADLEKLIAHAGTDANAAAFKDLYKSDDWAVISALINTNLRAAQQEAFGVHFFSAYRGAVERTLNHPVLGIYPLSWSLKISREWAKFLFDNHTLGLQLGMAPAQAIAHLVHAQQSALAVSGGSEKTDLLSQQGPLKSAMLVFNLLLPGDWSSMPFPLSRTIRDIARPALAGTTIPDPGTILMNNLKNMGGPRDLRLLAESVGQVKDMIWPPQPKGAYVNGVWKASSKGSTLPTYHVPTGDPAVNLDVTR